MKVAFAHVLKISIAVISILYFFVFFIDKYPLYSFFIGFVLGGVLISKSKNDEIREIKRKIRKGSVC